MRRSNTFGALSVGKNLLPLAAVWVLAPVVADHSLLFAWCLVPASGLLMYRLTIVMHDCTHATLFASPVTNHRMGRWLGFVTGIDFHRFRLRHWEHHDLYGEPGDPQGFHYLGIRHMRRQAFLWHVFKPLLGFNLPHVMAESYLHPANLRRLLGAGGWVSLLGVQLAIALVVTGGGRHLSLLLLPPISAATVGLFLSQVRGITEHGVRGGEGPTRHVRSHRSELAGRLLLYDLHFNCHEEHHSHPSIPSRHLPALAGETLQRQAPSMWETLLSMLAKP
jgi:fatty acid desaturase